ncbi:AES protein, partial [Atractosteus spatula]|nr:AES protein [Atractosteus spatula]
LRERTAGGLLLKQRRCPPDSRPPFRRDRRLKRPERKRHVISAKLPQNGRVLARAQRARPGTPAGDGGPCRRRRAARLGERRGIYPQGPGGGFPRDLGPEDARRISTTRHSQLLVPLAARGVLAQRALCPSGSVHPAPQQWPEGDPKYSGPQPETWAESWPGVWVCRGGAGVELMSSSWGTDPAPPRCSRRPGPLRDGEELGRAVTPSCASHRAPGSLVPGSRRGPPARGVSRGAALFPPAGCDGSPPVSGRALSPPCPPGPAALWVEPPAAQVSRSSPEGTAWHCWDSPFAFIPRDTAAEVGLVAAQVQAGLQVCGAVPVRECLCWGTWGAAWEGQMSVIRCYPASPPCLLCILAAGMLRSVSAHPAEWGCMACSVLPPGRVMGECALNVLWGLSEGLGAAAPIGAGQSRLNHLNEASSQSSQPLKFTTSDSCDRIKDEFQFLQAQYHRQGKALKLHQSVICESPYTSGLPQANHGLFSQRSSRGDGFRGNPDARCLGCRDGSDEFDLKLECDKLASEKSEMQRHYIMRRLTRAERRKVRITGYQVLPCWSHGLLDSRGGERRVAARGSYYEMSYGLNIEMHKQAEIVKRLNGICAQVLPYLSQEHQQQVLGAIERAKQVTPPEMNSIIRQQLQAHQLSQLQGLALPMTPLPLGLTPPTLPAVTSSSGLFSLSSILASQAHLAKEEKAAREGSDSHRDEEGDKSD